MLLVIKKVLDQNQLKVISKLLEDAEFDHGNASAGKEAAQVKHNLELSQETRTGEVLHQQLNQMLMPSLLNHPEYQNSVYPLKVAAPFYARYDQGMHYGYHIDDPIMGRPDGGLQERYRSDVSTTIFLNNEYEGGELVIRTPTGEQSFRCEAGDAFIYSSNFVHKVNEVSSGTRMVAVTWAQSMVKDDAKREILYELNQVRESLNVNSNASDVNTQLDNVFSKLLRQWSDL